MTVTGRGSRRRVRSGTEVGRGRDFARPRAYFGSVPRIPRCHLPDGLFHVTARSIPELPFFRDDVDRRFLLTLLSRVPRRFGPRVHAYCLMGTHYHAVVEGATERLSPAVQWFQGHYAREFNARHGRRGALFAERFSSWVVHDEDHSVPRSPTSQRTRFAPVSWIGPSIGRGPPSDP